MIFIVMRSMWIMMMIYSRLIKMPHFYGKKRLYRYDLSGISNYAVFYVCLFNIQLQALPCKPTKQRIS
ncbi:MAG: hypothetical protein EAZ74_02825 [Alphaproteobacteria bacterium]|nr:MAG: hypothetical protein EAY76_02610 [Alphaproteobacteria bacterium]TAF14908.1 MAG: hypothetical protein EAZ74_02825 [Alphaproteobacteria bacterium]TAF38783.1 MAG: hypothetical protein EAZ66_05805 [Alphaproteobacteria bacterium]TAF77186.1 MAG: hypothetical protein EAZ52_01235 [Alphaproteobacteria bacterium]